LRWSLSKIRPFVDDPSYARLVADRQTVELRTDGLDVDFFALIYRPVSDDGSAASAKARSAMMGRVRT
jgi:hypothetical protein